MGVTAKLSRTLARAEMRRTMLRTMRLASRVLAFVAFCATAIRVDAQAAAPVASAPADTLTARCGPPGFGSLREEDIAIKLSLLGGLQVTATPLDECFIRVLSPDTYRVLKGRKDSRQKQVDSVAKSQRLQSYSLWSVLYYTVEQGETRFSPNEFVIRNVGKDFRPLRVLPLSTGFGEYRLTQREQQRAILVFDGQVDVNQPLSVIVQGTPSTLNWQDVVRKVEQERTLVRSRAAAKTP